MFDKLDGTSKFILYILMFPLLFQGPFLSFAWGADDELWIALGKRILLLLPVAAIIAASWVSIVCLLSVIVRQKRRQFMAKLFITWWDLGRAIFSFWGGLVRFLFQLLGWCFGFLRLMVLGLWLSIQDILLAPLRIARDMGQVYVTPGTPWIAVMMTLLWSALEAVVFTFVTTPLVNDVLEGLTDGAINGVVVRIILYLMMLAFVVGSYAIVSTLEKAIKNRDIKQIILVGIVEFFTLIFEVMFLYREFVDALVPWFAQHSGGEFSLGIVGTLSIAATAWLGIRGMTWFLFAGTGTPTIMAIIQRTGLRETGGKKHDSKAEQFVFIKAAIDKIRKEIDWVHETGDEMLSAFILPPLQIVAATVNFCTLLFNGTHVFELPFESFKDLANADELFSRIRKEGRDD